MKKIAALILSLAMLLALSACGSGGQTPQGSAGGDGATIVLRASHSCANTHPYQLGLERFAELVKEKTNGAVEIDIFHSAQLGDERANIEDLQMGTLDIAVSSTGPLGNFVEDFLILDLPFLFTSYDHAHAVLDGEIGQNLLAKLDNVGIVGGAFWENGFREMTNSKHPINSVADCAGLKLRCMENQVHMDAFSALGMDPTPMAWSEVFTSLQQKVIDGQENPIETIYNFQYYDVQNYLTVTNHLCTAGVVACNNDWYEGLSDEFKAAVDKAAEVAEAYSIEELNTSEAGVLELLKDKMTVTELTDEQLSAFQEKAKTAWPQLREEIGADYFDQFLAAANLTLE